MIMRHLDPKRSSLLSLTHGWDYIDDIALRIQFKVSLLTSCNLLDIYEDEL